MATAKKPTNYKTLRKQWYAKLKTAKFADLITEENPKGNFKDIELPDGKFAGWNRFARDRAVHQHGGFESKAEYARLAGWFLNDYEFETHVDRIIWEYHMNGLSIRDITETLRKAKIKSTNRDYVHKALNRLQQAMIDKYVNHK